MSDIPEILQQNKIAELLNSLQSNYAQLAKGGSIKGLIVVDQDAKVIAVNRLFMTKSNFWDLGAIGAALFGVSRQAKDFFSANEMEHAMLIYGDTQFFVHSIGAIKFANGKQRELLIVVLADKNINIGLVMLQLRKFAPKIKNEIEKDMMAQETMQMTEKELKQHILNLKKELYAASRS